MGIFGISHQQWNAGPLGFHRTNGTHELDTRDNWMESYDSIRENEVTLHVFTIVRYDP